MSDEYLVRPMSRAEQKLLSDVEKRERKLARGRINYHKHKEKNKEKRQKYYKENRDKIIEQQSEYYQENKDERQEYNKEYSQTPSGKKSNTISAWGQYGLRESKEDLEWIYDLFLHQELCYSCDVKLTRGVQCATQACMDHSHTTNRFRQICCRDCNIQDRWMTYWC